MKLFKTEEEKKSFMITSAMFIIVIALLFITTFPPDNSDLEGGGGGGDIAINFGYSDFGSGDNFDSKEQFIPVPELRPTTTNENPVITSDNDDAIAIDKVEKKDDKKKTEDKKPEVKKTETKPTEKKPDKSVTDAFSNLLNSGDGNTGGQGNQGKTTGNTNDRGYNGGGGSGTGSGGGNGSGQGIGTGSGYGSGSGSGIGNGHGNYQLAGRKAITKPQPKYDCNEQGTVVVEIIVNKAGKVIEANAGVRGTTNTARCLIDVAKKAALDTKFDENPNASDRQIGKITYNFRLTE